MKNLIGIVLITTLLLVLGCTQGDNLDGKWKGSIIEKDKSTLVMLALSDQQGMIEGSFTILSETGENVGKGMTFQIVQAERSGNSLRFIVPISGGKVDKDAIAFELLIEEKHLRGHGHELRKGSDNIPVIFTRQE